MKTSHAINGERHARRRVEIRRRNSFAWAEQSCLGAPGSSCRAAPGSRWRLIYDGGVMAALMAAAVVQIDLVVAMMTAATDHDHPRRRC